MQDFGSLILFTSEDGDFELAMEAILKKIVYAKGIPINPITNYVIKKIVQEDTGKIKDSLRKKGFPKNISMLFNSNKKKEALKIASETILTKDELCCAIFNCQQVGYTHFRKHKYFLPREIIPTDAEREGLAKNGVGPIVDPFAKKLVTKIGEHFKQRRYVSAHLFEKNDEWHLFYFDFKDAFIPYGLNHYEGGPHIHYVSHLWGIDKKTIWDMLEERQIKINSTHIRYSADL